MSNRFLANIIIRGKIEVVTGLHIGGSKEKLEIGGVDSPVLRDPYTKYPYIPGSSIKGKLRMSLEYAEGKIGPKGGVSEEAPITTIFGTSADGKGNGPTRLIIRDSYPDNDTIKMWDNLDSELLFTEYKPENSLNRLTSEANPRFLERVIKDSKFNLEIIYGVYDINGDNGTDDVKNFPLVVKALRLLEHSGLGGSVSRGYGRIKFHFTEPLVVKQKAYEEGSDEYRKSAINLDDLKMADFSFTLDKLQEFKINL